MDVRFRVGLGLAVIALVASGSLAIAQPRRGGAKPPPPPAVDASASSAKIDDGGGPVTTAVADAGVTEAIRTDWDASAKLSPLTPSPAEFPQGVPEGGAAPIDYDKIIADVAALRARAATLSDGLFRSRIAIEVETDGDKTKLARLLVSIDDGVVYTAPSGFRAEDYTPVFEHSIAPGKHAITVEAERGDGKDESFKTSDRTRFIIDVPKDHRVVVQVRVGDDSTMGADFPGDHSGKYDLRFRVKAVAKPAAGK